VKAKVLFVVTHDAFFYSHRLPIAKALLSAGCQVAVATRVGAFGDKIKAEGLELYDLGFSRRGINPLSESLTIWEMVQLYRRYQPDVVHHVAMKPVIYGTIAARLAGVSAVVNALTGLGYVFSSRELLARILRMPLSWALRVLLDSPRHMVIVQNQDDYQFVLNRAGVAKDHVALIRGSGVDLTRYDMMPESFGAPNVVLISRMLWSKGVGDFVAAARLVREQKPSVRCVLVGGSDEGNPQSISEDQLKAWNEEGVVEWSGPREDIPRVLAESHVAVLPSAYGEGIPKSLIEAAACGRPIVTTDSPGCREIVENEVNGLLVPVHDIAALADAILRLCADQELRLRMGRAGRERVKKSFSQDQVVGETLEVYRRLLGSFSVA
jgi:glycosyltransferase involved in cell wall biosynthesis